MNIRGRDRGNNKNEAERLFAGIRHTESVNIGK
jgi:hypothetical protein